MCNTNNYKPYTIEYIIYNMLIKCTYTVMFVSLSHICRATLLYPVALNSFCGLLRVLCVGGGVQCPSSYAVTP